MGLGLGFGADFANAAFDAPDPVAGFFFGFEVEGDTD